MHRTAYGRKAEGQCELDYRSLFLPHWMARSPCANMATNACLTGVWRVRHDAPVLGCCGVVVGVFTFTEARPSETSLIGSLAAIAVALPVMRNALPGSPPLGVEGISVG